MTLTLRQARRLREKTQAEMAEFLNISLSTYVKLEEKPDEATIKQAKKISEYLEVPYDEIFFS